MAPSLRFPAKLLVATLVAAALVLAGGIAWWWRLEVDLEPWRTGPPPAPWSAYLRQERVWREEGLERPVEYTWVPLAEISRELQLAVLVEEDINFFGHGPLDPTAIHEAVRDWWRGRRLRGASTITQQTAKVLFLHPERSWKRKLREARLAYWMEHLLGKRRVFELYLNVVPFHAGSLGAEQAAQHYYGVSARDIDREQAAGLAACLPSPARDNPRTATPRWTARRAILLARMESARWLRARLEALERL